MRSLVAGTLGTQKLQHSVGGFSVSEVLHPAGFRADTHAHRLASIKIVLGGGYAESVAGTSAVHPPWTVVTKPSGATHENRPFSSPTHSLLIERADTTHGPKPVGSELFGEVSASAAGVAMVAVLRLVHTLRDPSRTWTDCDVEEALIELLAQLSRSPIRVESRPAWLGRVTEALRDQPRGRVDLGRIAEDVQLDRCYLSRAFRRATGSTLSAFARSVRLERAMTLLADTDRPIASIAYATGFCDQAHLTHAFKAATGSTPARFRALAAAT